MNHPKARSLSPSLRALTWRASLSRLRASATALAGLSVLGLGAPLALQAQGNDAWSTNPVDGTFTGNNWTTGTTTPGAPTGTIGAGDNLYFGTSSIVALNNNETAGFSIGSFTFISGASAFTITGNSIALGIGGITNNSTSLQTINTAFTLAATSTFTTATGGGNLALGGAISGAGGLTKAGAGTLTLTALSSYTGGTILNAGTLALAVGGGTGAIRGAVTLNTGATLSLTATDALGFNTGNVTGTLNVNGGTVNNAVNGNQGFLTNFNLTAGTATSTGGGAFVFGSNDSSIGILSNASATTSSISAPLTARNSSLTFTVADGAAAVDLSVSGVISSYLGTEGIIKAGAGTLALTASSNFTGATNVNAGTLVFSGAGSVYTNATVAGALNVASGATVRFDRNDALGASDVISPVIVTVNGGTLASNGFYTSISNPTFNTGTLLSNGGPSAPFPGFSIRGTVTVGGSGVTNFNVGTGTFNNITLGRFNSLSDIVTFNVGAASNLNVNNVLTNQGNAGASNGLIKTGAGTMTLGALNTYTGGTTVNGGTLVLNTTNGAGTVQGVVTVNTGATLSLAVADALGYTAGAQVTTVNVAGGTVINAAPFTAGNLSTGNQGFLTSFNLTGGTLSSTNGGGYNFNAGGTPTPSIASSASPNTSVISAPVIIRGGNLGFAVADGAAATDLQITGTIISNQTESTITGITKTGAGLMVLAGNNPYTGGTAVTAGTLLVNNTSGSGTGTDAVVVSNTGTTLGGTGTIAGATTINTGSTITANTLGLVGALTLQSTLTINGGTYAVDLGGATADRLNITGALSLTGANITFNSISTLTASSYVLATFASRTGTFSGTAPSGYSFQFNGGNTELDLVAVPEPATWLAGVLLVGLVGVSQRRKIGAVLTTARSC